METSRDHPRNFLWPHMVLGPQATESLCSKAEAAIFYHWAYVLCPFSRILNNSKTQRFGNWICIRLQVNGMRRVLFVAP
jgi:hypothetical protein